MLGFRVKGDWAAGLGVLDRLDLFDEKFHGVIDEKVYLLHYGAEGEDRLVGDGGTVEAYEAEIVRKLAEAVVEVVEGYGRDVIAAAEDAFAVVRPGVDDAVDDRNDF